MDNNNKQKEILQNYDDNYEIINNRGNDLEFPLEDNEYYEPNWQGLEKIFLYKSDIERILIHCEKYGPDKAQIFLFKINGLLNGRPARIKYKKDNELFKELVRNIKNSADSYLYRNKYNL